jgi:transcriptional regulator of acetoin/glycerol metabolism
MGTSGDTTRREQDSGHVSAEPRALALHWVHPHPRVDPLAARNVIGRGDDCDLCIASEGASRAHVEIHRQGPIYALRDLGSTNGTFLNGVSVQHAAVGRGDVLRVGAWVGVFADTDCATPGFEEIGPGLFGGHELKTALNGAREAAQHRLPILLVGATGTGKERVARAIHTYTGRAGRLQALNCAAVPENLAESELFGHQRGAFSGAERESLGHFRVASGGTLFLDEIAELPLTVQSKLLRAVEHQQITPLGSTTAVTVDVQLVSAVQRPLAELVAEGRFREDLAARLSGLVVVIPKLAERRTDVPRLFERFLARHSGGRPPALEAKLVESLCLYSWPQNVRELEMLAHRLLARHATEPTLRRSHLPAELREAGDASPPEGPPAANRREHDLARLARALRECDGNVKLAAEKAGFSRQRAYRLLKHRSADELLAEVEGAVKNGVSPDFQEH